jgi:ATP adenylyltransferase
MQTLWAPWRLEFITRPKPDGCIFCLYPVAEDHDRENLVLARSKSSFVMLNRFPYNNGHVMVIPRKHTGDLSQLTGDELIDLHGLLGRTVEVLSRGYQPDGFNVGMNLGKVAGAGIADHLHYHIVPVDRGHQFHARAR